MGILDEIKTVEIKPHGHQYKEFIESGGIVISPSGLRVFLENSNAWKKNTITRESDFDGNLNTEIGSYIHYYAELFYDGKLNKDGSMGRVYKDAFMASCRYLDLNSSYDAKNSITYGAYLDTVCNELRVNYLEKYPKPQAVEGYLEYKLDDKVMIAGSYDALEVSNGIACVVDFKTTRSVLNEKSMINFVLQLSTYAALINKDNEKKYNKMTDEECKNEYERLFGKIE